MRIRERHGTHFIEAIPATATVVLYLNTGRRLQVEQTVLDGAVNLVVDFGDDRSAGHPVTVYDTDGNVLAELRKPVEEPE